MDKKFIAVIPSVRNEPMRAYLAPLIKADIPIIVVDDSRGTVDRKAIENHRNFIVATDAFVEDYLGGRRPHTIPMGNPSCKNFGLFFAWKEGYKYAILLDDDCKLDDSFVKDIPLGKGSVRVAYKKGDWVNTLSLLGRPDLYSRGFPYEYRQETDISSYDGAGWEKPYFNMGLWTGEPDINGIDKIKDHLNQDFQGYDEPIGENPGPWHIPTHTVPDPGLVALNAGQNLPLSIMNCQIHRSLIPAFWQPPDYAVANGYRIRRHDDVWSMYLLKRVMDLLNLTATFGKPTVQHMKRGNFLKEAVSENVTNLLQYHFTRAVDRAYVQMVMLPERCRVEAGDIAKNMAIRIKNSSTSSSIPGTFRNIIFDYANGLIDWVDGLDW